MPIPLDILIDKEGNVYETTCVAIKHAERIERPVVEEGEVYEEQEKVVSEALDDVLEDRVDYQVEKSE